MREKLRNVTSFVKTPEFLGAGFAISIVTANLTASKLTMFNLPLVGDVTMPAGFLGLAVAFLFSDAIAELHGKKTAHRTVTASILGLIIAYGLVYASVFMPTAPFYANGQEFATIMTASGSIIVASILTTLVSQNFDVYVFHKIRDRTGKGNKWIRNVFSTGISQVLDTSVFIILGFVILPQFMSGSKVSLAVAGTMIFGQYSVKVLTTIADTPFFYVLTYE